MIEVIYNENSEDKSKGKTSLRLPKNIRQIGNTEDDFKIYIEDYVVTFLNQLTEKDLSKIRVAILMGDAVESDAGYLFISGAIYVDDIVVNGEGIHFTDTIWNRIYENVKEYFDTLEIVGWYLSVPGFPIEMNENIKKVHINQFAGNKKVLMMHEPIEKEEVFFRYENGRMKTINGYYIYYEKNNLMQTYMIDHRSENEEESRVEEKTDDATKHFRSLVQEKQEEIHKRKIMAFMYSVSSVLVMIVLIIGITMLNNYDKMTNMEKSLAILTKNVIKEEVEQKKNQEDHVQTDKSEEEALQAKDKAAENAAVSAGSGKIHAISVETVSGDVEPITQAPPQTQESASKANAQEASATEAPEAAQVTEQPEATQAAQVTEQPEATQVTEMPQVTEVVQATEVPQATEQPKASEQSQTEAAETSTEPKYYVIEQGDTLAKISWKIYNTRDMVGKICEINNIEDVDKIFVGQKILLP